ncbi:MAG: DUF3810 domain-containing protein [bacterium]
MKLRAGIIGVALAFFFFVQILSQYPAFVENYYSNGFYLIVAFILSNFSSLFPFSLSEFTIWFSVIFGLPFILYRIRKLRMPVSQIFLNLIITASVIYVWFYLCWGINYLRMPLKTKLALEDVHIPINAFDSTFVQMIRHANDLNLTYSIERVGEINQIIETSYQSVLTRLGLRKIPGTPVIKPMFGNWVLNKTITSGWFSPFFHEVHFNSDVMIFELPFIIAHEKAHRLGYTSEAEANFLAFLVCVNAKEPLCQYSGYFQVLSHFLINVREQKRDPRYFSEMMSDGVKLDMETVKKRWQIHRGVISRISNKSYNLYLKLNQVEEGIKNYSMVVDLLVRYYAKNPG